MAFNWITDSYGRLAEWASSANRVASLLLALDQIDPTERPTNRGTVAGIRGNEFTGQTRTVAPD
jgi:vitamin B12/bleomycin/antimicrobial peptide transport system ATP-binding/permease protein